MAVVGKIAFVVLLSLMVAIVPHTVQGAMTCQMVINSLTPCATYVTRGGPVPPSCCSGISSLYRAATTTTDRQTACKCLEQGVGMIPGLNLDAASTLPSKCGVNIPYKISPSTDCSKYEYITY